MAESKQVAGLVGPVLVALSLTENPFVNPHLYDEQIPPVVYLSGVLLFIAGLAIVRVHNRWTRGWPVLVTLLGWLGGLVGLGRMVFPHAYVANVSTVSGSSRGILAIELGLLVVGAFLTYKAYSRTSR